MSIPLHSSSRAGSISSIKTPRSPASPYDPFASALSSAQARYTIANPQSLKAHNDACQDLPGGNTRTVLHSSPFPITFASGKGAELTSVDGDTYVDFLGEYTAGLFGHSNQVIAEAIGEAMTKGWSFGGPNVYEKTLAKKITNRFSISGIELVRFTNSGTEANTMALAAAIIFTGRKNILVFSNGYHGSTLNFKSGDSPTTNLPHDFIIAPYNDIPATKAAVEALPRDSLAAILVEPIQGSGGCNVGTKEFLHYLNDTAKRLGALFIVDEVMTSRLSYHGLSAALDLRPDLTTLGKWVGGGMSFGAFGGRKDKGIMALFDPRTGPLAHSGTFNNNIITMAAGSAGLDLFTEERLNLLNELGESLKKGVEDVLRRYNIPAPEQASRNHSPDTKPTSTEPSIHALSLEDKQPDSQKHDEKLGMYITGRGSILAIHFCGPSQAQLRHIFWHHLIEEGIYMAQRGFIALNMEHTEKHVVMFVKATEVFVGKYRVALGG